MTTGGANRSEEASLAGSAAVDLTSPAGILPSQDLRSLVAAGRISGETPIGEDQIQPASLDLRLGAVAWRVRASFLPGPEATVMDRVDAFGMHRIDLTCDAVLEKGCVYIVPLMERVDLPAAIAGMANPKSSTGRLDVFTRLITDRAAVFDRVAAGYAGPLYIEISPRTFSVVVRRGTRLNQLRLQQGPAAERGIGAASAAVQATEGLAVTVDLAGGGVGPVGYRARRYADLIDFSRVDHYESGEFWEAVHPDRSGHLILNPNDFYILASKEAVVVPADHAAEMRPYDTHVGEFRVHYAGFFDPGFGDPATGGAGSRAVLEIRSFEVPFALRHGQLVGRLIYERLTQVPDKLYGAGIGSSYQRQGLALAKQFRRR